MRTGWFRAVHVKTESCYWMRLLLTHRRNLKRKFLDLENAIRHSLKSFGIKLGGTSRGTFDQAVREAVADDPLPSELMDAMLMARAALWKEYGRLHDLVMKMVAQSELCRRFNAYAQQVLAPTLQPGDIVILDNLPAHKVAAARKAIKAVGARMLFLPPYSPDFNPIENAFSKLKSILRKVAARTVPELRDAIRDALPRFTPDECTNYLIAPRYEPE